MMYEITENVIKKLKIDNYHIFFSFKESNKKVSMAGIVSKNIFDADINSKIGNFQNCKCIQSDRYSSNFNAVK